MAMKDFSIQDGITTFLLVLVVAQAFSWLVTAIARLAGISVPSLRVGPVLMLLLIAAAILAVWRIAFFWIKGVPISNPDLVILLVIVGSVVLAYYFFPKLVPQLFEGSMSTVKFAVQAMIGR